MLQGKKIVVVLPAYNASRTLLRTLQAIPRDVVDDIILVDDCSRDDTVEVSRSLGIKTFVHEKNLGYGANQKTCYSEALGLGAVIVVMVHPDFQYDPKYIPAMVAPIARGEADAVFGSRMVHPEDALKGGMPRWKWYANKFLTMVENFILRLDLTEYHSGFRAYHKRVLELPIELNSNNFVFDTEIIVQMAVARMRILEIPISTRYFPEASMIGFGKSVRYGLSILVVMIKYILHKLGFHRAQFTFDKIKSGVTCRLCGERKVQLLKRATAEPKKLFAKPYAITEEGAGEHGDIYKCLTCRASFVQSTGELEGLLHNYYKQAPLDLVYIKDVVGRKKTAREVLKYVQGKTLLDFGCNTGIFLDQARTLGYDVTGVEASSVARAYAKQNYNLDIVEAIPEGKQYDVITIFDVLEHVSEPKALVQTLSSKLTPGGAIVITAPDIGSPTARLMGKRWHALVPGHLTYFNNHSISYLARVLGMKVVKTIWYKRYLTVGSMINRLLRRQDLRVPIIGDFVIAGNTYDEPLWILKK